MDANGTRLFMLLGRGDWGSCSDENGNPLSGELELGPESYLERTVGLGWDAARSEVILHPRLMKYKAAPRDVPPTVEDRRGAARDRYGNWYWIDRTKTEILVSSSGTGTTAHFWSSADGASRAAGSASGEFQSVAPGPLGEPCSFAGLAVTEDHFLVVGLISPAGLLAFDLHAGGAPRQMAWPAAVKFEPFDMSAARGGGVWILDRANRRYWAIDRNLNVVGSDQSSEAVGAETEDFHPESGPFERRRADLFPTGIPLPVSSPVEASDPIAIEALPDGTVLILDTNRAVGSSTISRYRFGARLGRPVLLDPFELAGHDFAFMPEHTTSDGTIPDRLYVASTEGNQSYAFTVSLDEQSNLRLELIDEYYPMRLFGGKGLVASGTTVFYDFGIGWIPLIQQRRPHYTIEGTLLTPGGGAHAAFDGREPDCVWHRLLLDGCIPAGTEVAVWSRAANEPERLGLAEWSAEPPLHLREDGSEIPFAPRETGSGAGTWELLVQSAIGRYLQLRLTLRGDGKSTPRIRRLRIYGPRFSYLRRYLPAVYREDGSSASFLERFLANFEGTYTAIEDKIGAVQLLFDPRSAPGETLEWLAGWLGAALDPAWDEDRRRLFIKYAMTLYRLRGTIRGLRIALHLALDECVDESLFAEESSCEAGTCGIRIIERFRTRSSPGVLSGDPTELSGPREVPMTKRWQPSLGRDPLRLEYGKQLGLREGDPLPVRPPDGVEQREWSRISEAMLGFVPSSSTEDAAAWREFLARRYRAPEKLNETYALGNKKRIESFDEAQLPEHLPPEGVPLFDWYQFETIVAATRRLAHRFRVLLPLAPSDAADRERRQRRLELAQRIIALEKPAHTVFDVRFYWDLFRVGMVRLGSDTVLGAGGRADWLVAPAVLGRSYLLESYLAPGPPLDARDRQILGRDRLRK